MTDPMALSTAGPLGSAALALAAWWVKGALVLALGWGVARLLGRRSAAARHLAWTAAVMAALVLSTASGLLPALDVPLPEGLRALSSSDPAPARGAAATAPVPEEAWAAAADGAPGPLRSGATEPATTGAEPGSFGPHPSIASAAGISGLGRAVQGTAPLGLALSLWLTGAVLLLLRSASGRLARRRLLRDAAPPPEPWLDLVAEAPEGLRVLRPVRLAVAAGARVPMTWGVLRPVVVLPSEARSWSLPRLRDALFHELAHVRRLDVLTQAAAELLCALAWVDPLVWVARRRLCQEAEHASDDSILSAGVRPSLYAGHLLEAARALRRRRPVGPEPVAVAMARPSGLSARIGAVLDERRNRRPVSARQGGLWTAVAVAACLPLAAAVPAPPDPPAPPADLAATSTFNGTASLSNRSEEPGEGYFTQPRFRGRCEPGLITGRGYGTQVNAHDDRWTVVLSHGSCRLEMELEGEIRFTPDDRGIAWLGRGAEIRIEEAADATRELTVTPGPGGEPRYRWRVDGDERPFDAEAGRWLAGVLPEVFRATGLQAGERVARFLEAGGVPAVLGEIRLISSDHVQGLYFTELLARHRPSPGEAEALLEAAGKGLGSDYELAELLTRFPSAPLGDRRVQAAFVRAASTIGSDYEAGRVLKALLGRGDLAPETVDGVMAITGEIGSDYELAEVLLAVLAAYPGDRPAPRALFAAAGTLGSDYEHRRVLAAVIDHGALDGATVEALLHSAESIGSDYELAELLVHLARNADLEGPLEELYIETAEGIGSRYEHDRALAAVVSGRARGGR